MTLEQPRECVELVLQEGILERIAAMGLHNEPREMRDLAIMTIHNILVRLPYPRFVVSLPSVCYSRANFLTALIFCCVALSRSSI